MLAVSTKYALRALIRLAEEPKGDFFPISVLASEVDIPPPYLAKIINTLAKGGVLESKRGTSGGIRLRRKKTSFLEVCRVMMDPIIHENCILSKDLCNSNRYCEFHSEWSKERDRIRQFLRNAKIEVHY